jgi:heat shock protein HslJ
MFGKKMSWCFAGIVLVTIALAGCGGGPGAEVDLVGTEWTLTEMGGQKPLPDTTLTATFAEDGALSGNSGCNTYNTTYEVDASKISVNQQVASTMMMCEEAVTDQERAYVMAVTSSATYEIQGMELVLRDSGANALLKFTAG